MKLQLIERKVEVPGVESFIFEPAEPLTWKAGQFLHYVLHHEPTDDRGSDRWFTVATAPSEKHVMITTRYASEKGSTFKKELFSLEAGKEIEISSVEGDFIIEDTTKEYIFIAGGIGVTPFRSILKEMDTMGVQLKAKLLWANRDENIPYKAEFEAFASRNPNLQIHHFIGATRIDEAAIRTLAPNLQTPLFYVSGPEPMVEGFGNLLKQMGVPADHLRQDWFPGYPATL